MLKCDNELKVIAEPEFIEGELATKKKNKLVLISAI